MLATFIMYEQRAGFGKLYVPHKFLHKLLD